VAEAELALVDRLDRIRQRKAMWVQGHFDYRTAARDYAKAFRDAGLGEVGDDEAAVAARVRASGAAGPLVAALDDWAAVVYSAAVLDKAESQSLSWLLAVARRADPDPWRDRFRQPTVWHNRQALRALADEALRDGGAKLGELSPQMLAVMLGSAEAVPLLRAAQRRYPSDFWLNLTLGNALHEAKQYEEAARYHQAAVALRPKVAAAHHNLGNALLDKKDLDGAIAEFRTAIELDLNLAFAYVGLGSALYHKNDLEGAIAAFRKGIELDPKDVPAHTNLGVALSKKGDLDEAIAELGTAIKLNPRVATTHNVLGNALRNNNDMEAAITEYRKAIELDPNYAIPHYNFGLALEAKKDVAGAIAEFRNAIKLDPTYAYAYAALGLALLRQGQFAEARDHTQRCLELLPQRDPWRQKVSRQLRQSERLAAAGEKLSAILKGETEPAGAAELFDLGQLCQLVRRRYAAAARFYAGAFTADPKLAADPSLFYRYNAACSAALAAAGQGEDAKHLPDKAVVMLRRQALSWLHDDLALYAKQAERDAAAKQFVRQQLLHWREDPDLASVPDKAALDKLPAAERDAWQRLWADVGALLGRARAK
jgi:tetratricopeptide (TPR) repeat protein